MLGKFVFVKLLMAVGFVVLLLHVLFFIVTVALHVLFLAPLLGKKMIKHRSWQHKA
jgi:hypothetical protein